MAIKVMSAVEKERYRTRMTTSAAFLILTFIKGVPEKLGQADPEDWSLSRT